MTRLGWTILAIVVIAAVAFGSMLSFDPGRHASAPRQPAPSAPAAADGGGTLAVPVGGVARSAIRDSWGDDRDGGTRAHHGVDIPAPAGARVLAAKAGTVEKLFESKLGGTTLYVRSADRRWVHYYAHLAGYAPGIREGLKVRAGDLLGFVGDTGDAGPGNYHLHFGLQRMRPGERWWQGQEVNPYPQLAGTALAR
jgi:murein DD-endopeptidase MepM/ murein hydrolase activator NlpD